MKPFNHMEPCTQLTLFVIARRKNIVSKDSDGYVKVCIDLITTVLGKRLCYYPWDVEVVPDRNIDQDDVEEEGFTKRLRYMDTQSTKAFSMGDLMSSLPLHN
jgi:hypothetical protein